ncbi:hypothetical protein [Pseudooceanicola onchidii]|uniref:hypothetical protein n=1 Tax=Pseudooceanicola onchidii TaxID=2562279 RepID=UPI0010AACFA8|nr:hypothetical protein [Pseudooceanicola onchidii]
MLGLARLFLILFVGLTVVYVSVSLWSRQVRKGKLRAAWDDGDREYGDDRELYVKRGLEDYDDSFRRKLILLVYIVPVAVIAYIIYVVNYT